jgi:hypothetical protein
MIAETRTSGGFVGESDRSARDLEGIGSSVNAHAARIVAPQAIRSRNQ